MVDISEFKSGETLHFVMDDSGKLYAVSGDVSRAIAEKNRRGRATIESVDPQTNTIYFAPPLEMER